MSIPSEIQRIAGNVTDTFAVLESAGAPVTASDNSDQLPTRALQLANLKQDAVTTRTVTLAASAWTNKQCTAAVPGVSASVTNQLIVVTPAPASAAEFRRAGVQCDRQDENQLVFSAGLVPTTGLTLYITIMEVMMT